MSIRQHSVRRPDKLQANYTERAYIRPANYFWLRIVVRELCATGLVSNVESLCAVPNNQYVTFMSPQLEVQGLEVAYAPRTSVSISALLDVSFAVGGEILGILGESGSGKTTLAGSLLNLPQPA